MPKSIPQKHLNVYQSRVDQGQQRQVTYKRKYTKKNVTPIRPRTTPVNSLALVKVPKVRVTPFKKTTISPVKTSQKKGTAQVKDLTFKRRNSIPAAQKEKEKVVIEKEFVPSPVLVYNYLNYRTPPPIRQHALISNERLKQKEQLQIKVSKCVDHEVHAQNILDDFLKKQILPQEQSESAQVKSKIKPNSRPEIVSCDQSIQVQVDSELKQFSPVQLTSSIPEQKVICANVLTQTDEESKVAPIETGLYKELINLADQYINQNEMLKKIMDQVQVDVYDFQDFEDEEELAMQTIKNLNKWLNMEQITDTYRVLQLVGDICRSIPKIIEQSDKYLPEIQDKPTYNFTLLSKQTDSFLIKTRVDKADPNSPNFSFHSWIELK